MKLLRFIVLVPVVVWLQVSFFGAWRPFGVVPNLILVAVLVTAAFPIHASEVLTISVGGGFLLDVLSGTDFGLKTTYFCFLALALIVIKRTGAEVERLGMKIAAVASATILYNAVVLVPLLGSRLPIYWSGVVSKVAIEVALNFGLLLALDWPIQRLLNLNSSATGSLVSRE